MIRLEQLKDGAVEDMESKLSSDEKAKHYAIDATSEMMILQLKVCGDAINPPFDKYGFNRPKIEVGAEVKEASEENARPIQTVDVFHNTCKTSKEYNKIQTIHIYLLYAFKWTTKNVMDAVPEHTHMKARHQLSTLEGKLILAFQGYCVRPRTEIIQIEDHVKALERCYNSYERKIRHIVDMYTSTVKAVGYFYFSLFCIFCWLVC